MRRILSQLRLSISTRLALWFGLSFLLLLSVFVIFLYVGFHVSLHRDFQDQLENDLVRTLDLVTVEGSAASLRPADVLVSGPYDVEGTAGTYVRLLAPTGELLGRSANMDSGFDSDIPSGREAKSIFHEWRGTPARTVYTPIGIEGTDPLAWLEVTRLESALHDELHRLGWLLFAGVLLGSAMAVAAGHQLARRALRPVAQITEASRQIQAEDLDGRVPATFGVRDELTELAETLNALLDRLSATFARERRFRTDAAHEMFTPLSAIQSEIDVTLRRRRSEDEYAQALGAVQRHTTRLQEIVEGLLELSRAEALETKITGTVDAAAVAFKVVERFRARANERDVRLELDCEDDLLIAIDESDLSTVLSNLVDNALKYTPVGGKISVEVRRESGAAHVSISDTGLGFSEAERPNLFDRFYRATTASHDTIPGQGLGLSIVRAIVHAYEGQIWAESSGSGQGSCFAVTLPLAKNASSSCRDASSV